MDQEYWKPVAGYEGLYEVSSLGRVRTLEGERWNGQAWIKKVGRIRSVPLGKRGYPRVDLKRNGVRQGFTVHTLVLTAFVGPRPVGCVARHLNGDRRDSRLSNLCWGTYKENSEDSKLHGTLPQGEKHGAAKLTDAQVHDIRRSSERQADIAQKHGVSKSLVSMIRSGKRWAHLQ